MLFLYIVHIIQSPAVFPYILYYVTICVFINVCYYNVSALLDSSANI